MPEARRTFGPVVLAGIAGAGVVAFTGTRGWATPGDPPRGTASVLLDNSAGHVPLAGALGLVALACWGVVMVTRRRARRIVAALGAVVGAGLVATAVAGRGSALDSARGAYSGLGVDRTTADLSVWWWLALAGSLVALAAAVAAVRLCPAWPEMGSKYDAPVTAPRRDIRTDPESGQPNELDLWRAIDEGRDPTDHSGP
jgi:uncharacterized membrane protein (TIGR02234 family)